MKFRPFDYNADISEFSVTRKEIKDTLGNDERKLVEINITYPELKKDAFEAKASDKISIYYKKLAENFAEYAKKRLQPKAAATKDDSALPFSAVMKFIPTFENDALISIVTDVFVYSNAMRSQTKRFSNIFLKTKFGCLGYNDFFDRKAKDAILQRIAEQYTEQRKELSGNTSDTRWKDLNFAPLKKHFDENNLFLSPCGYGIYYDAGALVDGHMPTVFIIPFESFKEHEIGYPIYIKNK